MAKASALGSPTHYPEPLETGEHGAAVELERIVSDRRDSISKGRIKITRANGETLAIWLPLAEFDALIAQVQP